MTFVAAFPTKFPLFGKKYITLSFTESALAGDLGIVRSITKNISETALASEAIAKTVSRGFTENATASEVMTKTSVKGFSETVTASEIEFLKTMAKEFTETASAYEYLSHVYPFIDIRDVIRHLTKAIEIEGICDNPYIVHLLKEILKKLGGV